MAGLTARYVEGVKGVKGKRLEIHDEQVRGLSLRVTATGAKTWALRYRNQAGQQRRLTLGAFPALSLEKARKRAIAALSEVAVDNDPARDKQIERRKKRREVSEKPQTVTALWALYEREKMGAKKDGTQTYQKWLWAKHVKPKLGANELATLDRGTVRASLKEIGESAPTTANRALALLRHMMNYAVEEEFLRASPLAAVGAMFKETSRERVLTDAELKALWGALQAAPASADVDVSARMTVALKLILLTATRPSDVAGLQASEIDAAARSWTIPAERTKSGRAHVVPLSPDAWDLLAEAFGDKDAAKWKGAAFPNARHDAKAIERHSLSRAMARVRAEAKLEDQEKPIPRVTPHDLRRTAATYLASERIGVAPHVVSAVLGHSLEGPAVTSVYNRHRYDREKRAALEAWARLLAEIVADRKSSDVVVPMRKGARP